MTDAEHTSKAIAAVLTLAKETTVREMATYFDVLDEEPVTFSFILEMKRAIVRETDQLRSAVTSDIVAALRRQGRRVDEAKVRAYVRNYLVVRVKGHSRQFESLRSGADFGVVVEMPIVELAYGDARVSNRWNGVIVQAKRNWRARRKPGAFATLSSRKTRFDFAPVRKFLALGLYRFAEGQKGGVTLDDIRFVPLGDVTSGNEAFVDTVNEILRDGAWDQGVDAQEFFTAVSSSKIGTQNRREIEEFVLGSGLPCFRLTLRFRDNGGGLQEVIRVVQPQPVQVVERRT